MIKKIIGITLSISFLVLCSTTAQARQSWGEFHVNPLEIIYPEETALTNPPFIHWQPIEKTDSYKVILKSQDESKEWTTPFNSFTPEEPLPKGFYRVEIKALDKKGKMIQKGDEKLFQINVPGNSFYPSINRISFEKGKPIILPEDELEKLKTISGEKGEYRKKLLSHANAPLPETLKNLKEPKAYENEIWNFKIWKDNEIICFAVEDYLLHQTMAYKLTDDNKYLNNAREILNPVLKWDPEGSTGVWENDHSAHAILHSLSITFNQLRDDLPKTERANLVQAIEDRSRDMFGLLNPFMMRITAAGMMNDPDNNHPWFCTAALGMGALSLMGEVPEAEEWLVFCAQMFNGSYFPRGGRDGGWHEGLEYWSFNLFFVAQFGTSLKEATGINLFEHPWLKNTALFKIYIHPPKGGYVPFGDVKHNAPNDYDKLVMMCLASVYDDPLAWKYVDAIEADLMDSRLYYGLLWNNREGSIGKELPEIPFAKHFRDIGWVVSNNNVFNPDEQIILALHSGKFFGRRCNHSHADQNSFIITAGGDKLIWDAGYYDSYLSSHHRNYSRLSIAHNTILVNGVGQVPYRDNTDGIITQFDLDGKNLTIEGDAATCRLIYGGWLGTYLRNIEYKNENEFIIQDEIFCSEHSQITWLLHSEFPITYTPGDQTISIVGNKYRLDGTFETDEPLEVTIKTKFPVRPDLPADQIFKVESIYPEQYHLEIKTLNKLESWKPKLSLKLTPLKD